MRANQVKVARVDTIQHLNDRMDSIDTMDTMHSMDSTVSMDTTRTDLSTPISTTTEEEVTDKDIEEISHAYAAAAILNIPADQVPKDKKLCAKLLRERPGMIYGLHEVTEEGMEQLDSQRVIYPNEKHLLEYVSPKPQYIGQTIQAACIRMSAHVSRSNGCQGVRDWHEKLKKAAKSKEKHDSRIAMVIIETDIPGDSITAHERFYIEKYSTLHPNGLNMVVPGHHDDYVAAEILVAKRHIASYNKIIARFGDAQSLVDNILKMGKAKAAAHYNAIQDDFANWFRILSDNSEEEAAIVKKYQDAWNKLSQSEKIGILSHDPKYVHDFLEYWKKYTRCRLMWKYKIGQDTIKTHRKAWKKSSIAEVKTLAREFKKWFKNRDQSTAVYEKKMNLRLPDNDQLAEVQYVLSRVLENKDTERTWINLGFKNQRLGHEWLAKWAGDGLTKDVVGQFREEYAEKHTPVHVTAEEKAELANAAHAKKIEDAKALAESIRTIGPKYTWEKFSLTKDQYLRRVKQYKLDADTKQYMQTLPSSDDSKVITKAETKRRDKAGKVAIELNIDIEKVNDQALVHNKQEEARLFIKRAELLGKAHSGTKYKLGDSAMREKKLEFEIHPYTKEIMKAYPTTAQLQRAGRSATKMIAKDPNWLNTFE